MKRRGFLQALLAAPAVPYVPAIEARPFVDVAKVKESIKALHDWAPETFSTKYNWSEPMQQRWPDLLGGK